MKNIILYISMVVLLLNQTALAACNWKTGIKELPNGNYSYSRECHGEVGIIGKALKNTKEALEARKEETVALREQISELETISEKTGKALELKDLALNKSDEIALKWRDETYNQHTRLLKQQSLSRTNRWIYFGGGILAGFLSVWAAGQLSN